MPDRRFRVQIDVEVDPEGRLRQGIEQLKRELEAGRLTIERAQEAAAPTEEQIRRQGEVRRAVEAQVEAQRRAAQAAQAAREADERRAAAQRQQAREQEAQSRALVVQEAQLTAQLERAAREALQLQRAFAGLDRFGLGNITRQAEAGAAAARQLLVALQSYQRQLAAGVGEAEFQRLQIIIDRAQAELRDLRLEQARLQSEATARGPAPPQAPSFFSFRTPRGAEFGPYLQRSFLLGFVAQEAGRLTGIDALAQVGFSLGFGGPFAAVALAALAVSAKQAFDELRQEGVRAYQELAAASVAAGVPLSENRRAVEALRATYRGLSDEILAGAQATIASLRQIPVSAQDAAREAKALQLLAQGGADRAEQARRLLTTENEFTRSIAEAPTAVFTQAALDVAIRRGLARDPEAVRKAIESFAQGQTEALTGRARSVIEAAFAAEIGKLPEELTEAERRQALLVELVRQASPAYTTLASAVREYREQLGATGGQALRLGGLTTELRNQFTQLRGTLDEYFDALARANAEQDRETQAALVRINRQRLAEQQFAQIRDEFWRRAAEQDRQRAALEQQAITAYQAAVETIRQTGVQAAQDNPLVSLFAQMEAATRRAQSAFSVFGQDFVNRMAEMERATLRVQVQAVQLATRLSALRARQEAERLEQPVLDILGPDRRRLELLAASLRAATDIPALLAQAGQLTPAGGVDARRTFADQLRRLLQSAPVEGEGAFGREARRAFAEAVLRLTQNVPTEVSGDPVIRQAQEARRRALVEQARLLEEDVELARRRVEAGEMIQRQAREALQLITGGPTEGASLAARLRVATPAELREFLGVTAALSPEELTPEIRLARATALREQARRDERREEEALSVMRAIDEKIAAVRDALLSAGIKIAPDAPALVEIDVPDPRAVVERLGERPRLPQGVRTVGGDF